MAGSESEKQKFGILVDQKPLSSRDDSLQAEFSYFLNPKRLKQLLMRYQIIQNKNWTKLKYPHVVNKDCEVDQEARKSIIGWLFKVHQTIGLSRETFFMALALLDRFLHAVKVRPRYLECVAITCLNLASKTREEDHYLPEVHHLLEVANTRCGAHDIIRMERIILEKLKWNLNFVTSWDFLHVLYSLIVVTDPSIFANLNHSSFILLDNMFEKCRDAISDERFLAYPPSHIAVALISLEFQRFSIPWLNVTKRLSDLMQVPTQIIIKLREICLQNVDDEADSKRRPSTIRRRRRESWNNTDLPAKRKTNSSTAVPDDEEDIIRSIRQLYSDEDKENITLAEPSISDSLSNARAHIPRPQIVNVEPKISFHELFKSTGCAVNCRDTIPGRAVFASSGLPRQLTYAEVVRKPAPVLLSACNG